MKFSYEMNFALLNFMWTTAILAFFQIVLKFYKDMNKIVKISRN